MEEQWCHPDEKDCQPYDHMKNRPVLAKLSASSHVCREQSGPIRIKNEKREKFWHIPHRLACQRLSNVFLKK